MFFFLFIISNCYLVVVSSLNRGVWWGCCAVRERRADRRGDFQEGEGDRSSSQGMRDGPTENQRIPAFCPIYSPNLCPPVTGLVFATPIKGAGILGGELQFFNQLRPCKKEESFTRVCPAQVLHVFGRKDGRLCTKGGTACAPCIEPKRVPT